MGVVLSDIRFTEWLGLFVRLTGLLDGSRDPGVGVWLLNSVALVMGIVVSFEELVISIVTSVPVINNKATPRPNHFRRE